MSITSFPLCILLNGNLLTFSKLVHTLTFPPFVTVQTRYFILPVFSLWLASSLSALFIQIIISIYIQKGFAVIIFLVESQVPHQKFLSHGNLLYQLAQPLFESQRIYFLPSFRCSLSDSMITPTPITTISCQLSLLIPTLLNILLSFGFSQPLIFSNNRKYAGLAYRMI